MRSDNSKPVPELHLRGVMKVLFYHFTPFAFAHGGLQTQIIQTRQALERLGVQAEFLRWWDSGQSGDILHFFGRIRLGTLQLARGKGLKVVQAELLTEQGARSRLRLALEKMARRAMTLALPRVVTDSFHLDSYRLADACVALTEWEAYLMRKVYGAPRERIHVVPNGVEEVFLNSRPAKRGPWLVCAATIAEHKRVLELAQYAVRAQTPLWVIGKPYSEQNAYAQRFIALAKAHPRFLRYEGPIADRARLARVYREARGFVLLSAMESLSLSALEAAACECPLLLSRLPWATTVFRENACYCPVTASSGRTAAFLRQFYDAAPSLKPAPRPLTWTEVAKLLKRLYETLLEAPQ
ncbi:MAG TPA: glycosyltransferase family 4 protein [Verrucomicrobiota bacterium]|nr:glycosyltransferase family 4 protein [Verrucomicrobiota bacterium]